jgi:hypothetical protein
MTDPSISTRHKVGSPQQDDWVPPIRVSILTCCNHPIKTNYTTRSSAFQYLSAILSVVVV